MPAWEACLKPLLPLPEKDSKKLTRDKPASSARCTSKPAVYFPVIDRNRCEGKGECVRACPYGVFEVRTLEAEDHDALSFVGRLRSAMHGRKSAYTPNAARCQACGVCVDVCPEEAITLVTFGP